MKTRRSECRGSPGAAKALGARFYERPVLEVAPDLIGCTVVHGATAGVIVETEAYHQEEPACHAYIGVTARTSTIFGPPGVAYVYLSYGIHVMLNAVCEREGVGAAVLIRALRPTACIELMRRRRAGARRGTAASGTRGLAERELCSGPGRLTQALGIELTDNGTSLVSGPLKILPRDGEAPEILTSTRVGITKAVELPWRFSAAGEENVSRPWPSRSG